MNISRRTLLECACRIPTAFALASVAACGNEKVAQCVDSASLSAAENSLRASLQYTDSSNDLKTTCGACAYFRQSGDESGCGTCDILNGAVSVQGHCTSWSAKS